MSNTTLVEEACPHCDTVVHAVFDADALLAHKVGLIRCPTCGELVAPCGDCEDHFACDNCPWRPGTCEISKDMSNEALEAYLKSKKK